MLLIREGQQPPLAHWTLFPGHANLHPVHMLVSQCIADCMFLCQQTVHHTPLLRVHIPLLRVHIPVAKGTYPIAKGTYPIAKGTYPIAKGTYPIAKGTYPIAKVMLGKQAKQSSCMSPGHPP